MTEETKYWIKKEDLKPENVLKAYQETGLFPIQSTFNGIRMVYGEVRECGCAITASVMHKHGLRYNHPDTLEGFRNENNREWATKLQLLSYYSGFDGHKDKHGVDEEFYKMGQETFELVKNEIGVYFLGTIFKGGKENE